jgi:hypothetical protein
LKKIVFIVQEPLTLYSKQIYYIEAYQKAGFCVEYWDLHPFLYPHRDLVDEVNDTYCHRINSLDSFLEHLNSLDINNTIVIYLAGDVWKLRKVLRLISDKKCRVITINYHANTGIKLTLFRKLVRLVHIDSNIWAKFITEYKKIQYTLYKKKNNMLPFSRYFSTSSASNDRINHSDYETYKKLLNESTPLIQEKYIVFIDNYYPIHPDFRDFAKSKPINPENYYTSMKHFFDFLEKKYNMPVVIAAHPKAIYLNHEFGNRKIIKYNTGKLIQHSENVLIHASNSVSYAVLFDKPIAFIKTATMKPLNKYSFFISSLAKTFGKQVFNINKHEFEKFTFSKVSPSIADHYINNYLTSPQTKNKLNQNILIEEIKNIFFQNP